ncbi:polymorphic toxin-type HINT domain-containing protein [Streptomyces sp. NPDC000594]|uniref:polymorphic toxin-type HINT domain-containing protein n=1 Tax=Streptomyces sp. NPDC000594 TaxID=3154261 RepID=UPI0033282D67
MRTVPPGSSVTRGSCPARGLPRQAGGRRDQSDPYRSPSVRLRPRGQFISVDPLLTLDQHQSLNGYSYANQHPATSSDPTGLQDPGSCVTQACFEQSTEAIKNASSEEEKECIRHGCYTGKGSSGRETGGGGGGGGGTSATSSTGNTVPAEVFSNTSTCGVSMGRPYCDHGNGDVRYQAQDNRNGARIYEPSPAPVLIGGHTVDDEVLKELGLMVCGWIPLAGAGCDLYDGVRAADEGDKVGVALAGAGFIPVFGDGARLGKQLDRLRDAARPCNSFLAGTDVLMADGTTKNIEDVQVGDMVMARDPETGDWGPREVTHLIRGRGDKQLNELSIATEDGIQQLIATDEHPFWSPSERRWMDAADLTAGMTLLAKSGDTVVVTANRAYTERVRTYNLTVNDLHTYYVLAGETPGSGAQFEWSVRNRGAGKRRLAAHRGPSPAWRCTGGRCRRDLHR